ncbi:MAG: pilus assembly protein, partial [Candidatus Omnitrophica bacterium]|nr:pilus assembly protein [Candidatus Omnitrophota bacterium]
MNKEKEMLQSTQRKGQAIVETALMLPILFLIAGVVLDLANLVMTAHRITSAVREGARIATENPEQLSGTLTNCSAASEICAITGSNDICCVAVSRAYYVLY